LRGDMKQFYIIMSTIVAFVAMDFVYSGEFPPSCFGETKDNWQERNEGRRSYFWREPLLGLSAR
jgi:hypothetical protein